MAGLGALPSFGAAPAPAESGFGIPSFGGQNSAPSAPIDPSAGGAGGRANIGYAVGGIYDAYKKAKLDDITYSNTINKAGREQLNNIYEAGLRNPQMQTDPRVLQQINHLHATMGLPATAGEPGFDWASLQPVKTLDDLKQTTIDYFQSLQPNDRKRVGDNYGLVVSPDFYTVPAKLPQATVTAALVDYNKMMETSSWINMTPAQLMNKFENLRVPLGQAFGDYSKVDQLLAQPEMFSGMSLATQTKLDTIVGNLKKIQGVDPLTIQRIATLKAQAENQTSMAGLADVTKKLREIQVKDLPEKDRLFVENQNSMIADRVARRAIMQERVSAVRARRSSDPGMQDLQKADNDARAAMVHFDTLYYGAVKNYQTPDDTITAGWTEAHQNYDAIHATYLDAQSPEVRKAIAATKVQQSGAGNAVPAGSSGAPKTWGKLGNGARGYTQNGKYFNEQGKQVTAAGVPF